MKKLHTILLSVLIATLVACGGDDDAASLSPQIPTTPPEQLEESDIYKVEGGLLYAFVGARALRIFDISDARRPELLGSEELPAAAGEVFVRDGAILAIVDGVSCYEWRHDDSGWQGVAQSAVIVIDARNPEAPERGVCMPLSHSVVASRMSDRHLFVATREGLHSFALGQDLVLERRGQKTPRGSISQVHFTPTQAFLALEGVGCIDEQCERYAEADQSVVQVAALSAHDGAMELQGAIAIEGVVTGRFHMDARGELFRVVSYDSYARCSVLQIIDVGDPSQPRLRGSLSVGHGEDLKGTRFVDDRVYIVTFFQTDPLWIVDLSDPDQPSLLSELEVPGWSDFLFPRGDTLVTVGRGDGGMGVAVTLFDISDPRNPRTLRQISTSDTSASSEANVDHRGVTLIERSDGTALMALPIVSMYDCQRSSELRLLEVDARDIYPLGSVEQEGYVQRSLLVQSSLLSLSEVELLSIDISGAPALRVQERVAVEASHSVYEGYYYCGNDMMWDDDFMQCSAAGNPAAGWPLLLLALLLVARRRAVRL